MPIPSIVKFGCTAFTTNRSSLRAVPRLSLPSPSFAASLPRRRSVLSSPLTHRNGISQSESSPFSSSPQHRNLHLHEYQSKALLRQNGLNVQKGSVANSVEEAYSVSQALKAEGAVDLILKCQVLAGGRGKGRLSSGLQGGVKVCQTPEQVRDFAKQMLGYRLITHQTTGEGEMVNQVLIHEGVNIVKELYLAIVLDRKANGPAVIASTMGGMEIEDVVKTNPEAVHVFPIDVFSGISPQLLQSISKALGFSASADPQHSLVGQQIERLYELFSKCDATQVEINPLAVTDKGEDYVVCVDAKIEFDDNAAFRQKELFDMEDRELVDARELAATKAGLSFVAMDGNIGCLVNGAGLAMATMDILKLYGGSPANFLDVGGGSDEDQIVEAFKILKSDSKVKTLFVNIFGGIMRCDIIASGLVAAAKTVGLSVPLVVRLRGNNVDIGREILEHSGVKCTVVDDFDEAAKKACAMAGKA